MTTVAALVQEILALIQSLPAGANPYLAIEAASEQAVSAATPPLPQSVKTQLKVLSGFYALHFLALVGGLAVRAFRPRHFWVFRISPRKGYIMPHAQIAWVCCAVFLTATLQGLIWDALKHDGTLAGDSVLWKTMPWMAAFGAGWLCACSLLVNYLLLLDTHGYATDSWLVSAKLINPLIVTVPVIFLASIVPLSVYANKGTQESLALAKTITDAIAVAASQWTPTSVFSLVNLTSALPVVEALFAKINRVSTLLKAVYLIYGVWTVLMVLCVVITALLHLQLVGDDMLGNNQPVESNFEAEGVTKSEMMKGQGTMTTTEGAKRTKELKAAYNTLVYTALCFFLVGTSFAAASFYAASVMKETAPSAATYSKELLVPLWSMAVLGIPAVGLFVYNSVHVVTAPTIPMTSRVMNSSIPVGLSSPMSPMSPTSKMGSPNVGPWEDRPTLRVSASALELEFKYAGQYGGTQSHQPLWK